ncbi:MAG: Rieske 2Fe-2S domain-containing protein [Gammaproteobacteria bacterium]|nr:Rieske 2Fe-2S domain-containing protein [Gammaproteobacteria bacterium]
MATTAEYGLGPFTFPRGWFMIAEATELGDSVLPLRFFGNEFALYRGASGRLVLLDAICAHMGTKMARNTTSFVVIDGQIEGDSIRCPYHAWRYGPDGRCNDIPYHDGPIPARACVKSWPVQERYGCIWMWHDPEGGEPDYDIPSLPEWDDPQWVQWTIDHMGEIDSHPQEVIDNMADSPHLGPIHGSTLAYFENEVRDHIVIQRQGGGHKTLAASNTLLETDTFYTGPAILNSRLTGFYDAIMLIANTPVDDGRIKVWHGLMVQSENDVATEADVDRAREFQESSRLAFLQDFEVWEAKAPIFQIMQIKSDGPFHKIREWYRQFYNPREETAERQAKVNGTYYTDWLKPAPEEVIARGRY